MAERYMRYAVNVPANTETTVFTAPSTKLVMRAMNKMLIPIIISRLWVPEFLLVYMRANQEYLKIN